MNQALYAHMNNKRKMKKKKITKAKRGVAQVAECLPRQYKTVSSNPSTTGV
jgi:hypothetical protein